MNGNMDDSQLQEQVLYLTEEMHKVRVDLNKGDITMHQARLMMEFLQRELYALTGDREVKW